jgi:hypothetical protein
MVKRDEGDPGIGYLEGYLEMQLAGLDVCTCLR